VCGGGSAYWEPDGTKSKKKNKNKKQKKETDKQTQSWGGLGRCWKGWVYGVMN